MSDIIELSDSEIDYIEIVKENEIIPRKKKSNVTIIQLKRDNVNSETCSKRKKSSNIITK